MLSLGMKKGEAVRIGEAIVHLIRTKGEGGVRISIDAPRSVEIRRLGQQGPPPQKGTKRR